MCRRNDSISNNLRERDNLNDKRHYDLHETDVSALELRSYHEHVVNARKEVLETERERTMLMEQRAEAMKPSDSPRWQRKG